MTDRATVIASDAFYTRKYLKGLEGVDLVFLDTALRHDPRPRCPRAHFGAH